jgi:glycerol-3-phosphate cytidylyltransferase-like family protein
MCFLQAKALGDVLVVGLIPDREILRCKGPPVLNERERYLLVDAVKWVDEVLQGEAGFWGGCAEARGDAVWRL